MSESIAHSILVSRSLLRSPARGERTMYFRLTIFIFLPFLAAGEVSERTSSRLTSTTDQMVLASYTKLRVGTLWGICTNEP